MSDYLALRRRARIIRDSGGYDIHLGESNPVIFEDFVERLFDRDLLPTIWEPFAGHTGPSKNCDLCEDVDIELIAYDIAPCDARVKQADSTLHGPQKAIGGLFFHPPYFGTNPMSGNHSDLSIQSDLHMYRNALSCTAGFAAVSLVKDGISCLVCRDYRTAGRRIRLDKIFLELFEGLRFSLIDVWTSEPDIVLVMKRDER